MQQEHQVVWVGSCPYCREDIYRNTDTEKYIYKCFCTVGDAERRITNVNSETCGSHICNNCINDAYKIIGKSIYE